MAVETVKSTGITNLDASPIVNNTSGEGAAGRLHSIGGYVTVSASASVLSVYRLVRVPSNCKIKQVLFESEAQTAGMFQIGVYPSDSTTDGTNAASPTVATNVNLFANDINAAAAVYPTDYTFNAGAGYTLDKRNQALWKAAGLASDPGGFFDIVATIHTTAVTTGTGKLGICVNFTA